MRHLRKHQKHLRQPQAWAAFNDLKDHYAANIAEDGGALKYLAKVYKLVCQNKTNAAFEAEINRRLTRTLTIDNAFAAVIEVTSDLDRKRRWKYAKALRIADLLDVPAKHLIKFVKGQGGFSGVIKIAV